jgi:hypothetical protein
MFFTICVFGILTFRIGTAKLMRLGIHYGTLTMTLASLPFFLLGDLIHSPLLLE